MSTEKLFAKLTDAQQILQTLPSPFIGLTVYQTAFRFWQTVEPCCGGLSLQVVRFNA